MLSVRHPEHEYHTAVGLYRTDDTVWSHPVAPKLRQLPLERFANDAWIIHVGHPMLKKIPNPLSAGTVN